MEIDISNNVTKRDIGLGTCDAGDNFDAPSGGWGQISMHFRVPPSSGWMGANFNVPPGGRGQISM